MKNIFNKTIRAGIIFGTAFFAFTQSAFAQPMLTPVSVTHLTGTSATLVGHVSNPYKNSIVWFEFGQGFSVNNPTAVAVQGIYGDGSFEWNLRDLIPGQTYSYRAVAMEDGVTVYSPTSSFVAPVPTLPAPTTVVAPTSNQSLSSTKNTTSVTTQTNSPASKTTTVVSSVPVKQAIVTPIDQNGFTNNQNSASVVGTGSNTFPTTLLGWLALLMVILIMIIVAHMIYDAPEKRKRDLAKKKDEENKHRIAFV